MSLNEIIKLTQHIKRLEKRIVDLKKDGQSLILAINNQGAILDCLDGDGELNEAGCEARDSALKAAISFNQKWLEK